AIQVCNSASVAHQSACRGKRAKLIDGGHRVAEREHRQLFHPAVEEWIASDHEPAGLQWDQVCEGRINVASATRVQIWSCRPSVLAAACSSLAWISRPGKVGMTSAAIVPGWGAARLAAAVASDSFPYLTRPRL